MKIDIVDIAHKLFMLGSGTVDNLVWSKQKGQSKSIDKRLLVR